MALGRTEEEYRDERVEELAREREKLAPLFKYAGDFIGTTEEYPVGRPPLLRASNRQPQSSTGKCPCGSGKPFKNCHGNS